MNYNGSNIELSNDEINLKFWIKNEGSFPSLSEAKFI